MAVMPGVTFRPLVNHTYNGMVGYNGVILHIMEGTLDGSEAWFNNPTSQASSHFGVGKSGEIRQWVDTKDRAWAEMAGNRYWISIENEGHSGDSLTPAQLASVARIVKWCHETHGIPLQITDDPNGHGLGWHGMGGVAWGGHYDCPGDPIKNQRGAILAAAQPEVDMPLNDTDLAKIQKMIDDGVAREAANTLYVIAKAIQGTPMPSWTPTMQASAKAIHDFFQSLAAK